MFYIIIILFLFKLIKYNSKFTIINSTITGRVCVRIFRKLAKAAFHRRYRPLSQPAGLVSGAILSLVRSLTLHWLARRTRTCAIAFIKRRVHRTSKHSTLSIWLCPFASFIVKLQQTTLLSISISQISQASFVGRETEKNPIFCAFIGPIPTAKCLTVHHLAEPTART